MANTTMPVVTEKPSTEAERAAAADKARAEAKKNQDAALAANAEAAKLMAAANEDRAKADLETDPAKKPALDKTARESAAKADDARAKAAEADRKARAEDVLTTAQGAKVSAWVPDDMQSGDHRAQKFGNDPANPKSIPFALPNGQSVPMDSNVRLSRKTPDHPELVYTTCQPNMVGDYLRAGWNVDDNQPGVGYVTDKKVA